MMKKNIFWVSVFLSLLFFSCSVKNSTLKKGMELEQLGKFKEASDTYLSVLQRKSYLPEIENALRRSTKLFINEAAFFIAGKNEKGDFEQVVQTYYDLNDYVNQVNYYTKNIEIDAQTTAIYKKCLDQYLTQQYELGIKNISEQKFIDAAQNFTSINKFNPSYRDTSKQLNIAINEPVYLDGIQLFSEKKYIEAYYKWNEIFYKDATYKDVKNKLQQALNERYKEGSYFLLQENFNEAERAFEQVRKINPTYLEVVKLHKESICEPIYRKAVSDLKRKMCRTAFLNLEQINDRFESYKNSTELKNQALQCASYPVIVEVNRSRNSNGFEHLLQNAVIEEILERKNPFIKIIKGTTDSSSPYFKMEDATKNNNPYKNYITNTYSNTSAKAVLVIHIQEFRHQDEPVRSNDISALEVRKYKAKSGLDSIVEKPITYKEFEKTSTITSKITYRLVEINSSEILLQKTLEKKDTKQIQYARNTNSNSEWIYPVKKIANTFIKDESNYRKLQAMFRATDDLKSQTLIDELITHFSNQIVFELLKFNPEE